MYRLYRKQCEENHREPARYWAYRKVFRTSFNLGFFKPKKDQCDWCLKFERSSSEDKLKMTEENDLHLRSAKLSREVKALQKALAVNSSSYCAACYDMQQVLVTPRTNSSQLYYRRKLATYNLTVFDMGMKKGHCFMWHEGQAKRGAANIASCVFKFIEEYSQNGVTQFSFFTDNCGGQNKNRTIVGMYIHAVRMFKVTIEHYYLERGHTQNEGDSVHANIERAAKQADIFSPMQWYAIAATAKKTAPSYALTEMGEKMLEMDGTRSHYCGSMIRDKDGQTVRWSKMRVMKFTPDSDIFFFKYQYDDPEFRQVETKQPVATLNELRPMPMTSTVTEVKKKDLLWMCREGIIPSDHHSFYNSIATCTGSADDAEDKEENDELPTTRRGLRATRAPKDNEQAKHQQADIEDTENHVKQTKTGRRGRSRKSKENEQAEPQTKRKRTLLD